MLISSSSNSMDAEDCRAISECVSILSNPARVRILCVLSKGEMSVSDIAKSVELTQAHTSAHLRILYDRSYLSRHRHGKKVFYSVRDPRISEFLNSAACLAEATGNLA